MFEFPHGEQELWGIACRGDYDLKQHQTHSGKSMEIFDEASKRKYVPHVIEPSLGVDRTLLAVLTAAYTEDEVSNDKGKLEKRLVMKFSPKIAPYKAAVFPLLKNKPELVERAQKLYRRLQRLGMSFTTLREPLAVDIAGKMRLGRLTGSRSILRPLKKMGRLLCERSRYLRTAAGHRI